MKAMNQLMLNLSGPGYLKNVVASVNYIIIGTNLDLKFYSYWLLTILLKELDF
ncbi:protein of unknown function [Moritella yayanosii]|uniref:Uncharacterized protein n=1 Tax=Moritella yayanosii TaxID=69539 RepID=A0A330LTD7_9GAMM|nr:protein of unknown function [Moritella yayanosii]